MLADVSLDTPSANSYHYHHVRRALAKEIAKAGILRRGKDVVVEVLPHIHIADKPQQAVRHGQRSRATALLMSRRRRHLSGHPSADSPYYQTFYGGKLRNLQIVYKNHSAWSASRLLPHTTGTICREHLHKQLQLGMQLALIPQPKKYQKACRKFLIYIKELSRHILKKCPDTKSFSMKYAEKPYQSTFTILCSYNHISQIYSAI
ncbi:hypothetical protein [Aquitalea pelogenes]|uniref:hypothetical protein n=1 Tax=Aquitalea pelogenes TaxID=1293573 RepID=UPI0035B15EEF